MPDLRIFPSAELPRDIKCQILAFIRMEWAQIFRGADRFWDYTQKDTHPVNVVIIERGLVISHAEVTWRVLVHAGQAYKVYGVSAVFTYPAFRGEGYGTQVMRAATEHIRGTDADVAMLFCRPERVAFYQNAGWEVPVAARVCHGDQDHPHFNSHAVCLLFVSARGRAAREAFSTQPVYLGAHAW